MDAVEIKYTIRPDQELRAARAMEVDEDTADVRLIYFCDTPDLELFKAWVVLHPRLVKGDTDDSTFKFRPVEPVSVSGEWQQSDGSNPVLSNAFRTRFGPRTLGFGGTLIETSIK